MLLADEATGNLDPRNIGRILDLLFDSVDAHGATLLAVTHDHELLPRLDRLVDFARLLPRAQSEEMGAWYGMSPLPGPLLRGRREVGPGCTMPFGSTASTSPGATVPEPISMAAVDRIAETGLAVPIPLYVGFKARGFPIVGTNPDYFVLRRLSIAQGRSLGLLGECVRGARAAEELGLGRRDALLSSPKASRRDRTLWGGTRCAEVRKGGHFEKTQTRCYASNGRVGRA